MHYENEGGLSRRPPGMSAGTAKRSGPISRGKRQVDQRAPAGEDAFARFVDYAAARLTEDPHLWATALFDEVGKLGYDRSYPSFTRALRLRGLRPACEPCHPATGRPAAVIEHPAGEETQWDWVELPDPPAGWDGYGKRAYLLVGGLSHSSKWRGVLCESMERPQLADAQYQVATKLGGVTKDWRIDADGDRGAPRDRDGDRHLRPDRQALWCPCSAVSAAARQPQRRGGESEPHRRATLVAIVARRGHRRAGADITR